MGDCEEVFIGIARFYIHAINENADVEKLVKFQLHIYTNYFSENVFLNLKDYSRLKKYLAKLKLTLKSGIAMSNLEGILSKNVDCYFQKDNGNNYEYSHISFYEMESNQTSETATMNKIETGISLGGVLSGVPSSKYGQKYRTGFGTKFAEENELIDMAALYNSLVEVGQTGNPYHSGVSITTQIDSHSEIKMEYIYKSSNWVVFVEPKVDLDFFCEKEANSDLLIIHYSDQYTSSSGYDAITVTYKSEQYAKIIQEYLNGKSVHADMSDIKKIINLFNAVNGDWLLRLVSAKKIVGVNKDSTFSREKISIVAAIKFMLAYLKHPDIIWIPISMEEMLRVSGGAGLSQKEGILSSKNLGFDSGPTCDDLLFLGLSQNADGIEIYFYPVEIKTGKNDSNVITKAFKQVKSTSKGLEQALNPEGALAETIVYKVHRNFMMQLLITSCKKMDVYHVDDSQDWKLVLEKFRQALLNERYVISNKIQKILGIGAVLSFKREQISRKASLVEDMINFIEMPEADEYGLILKSVKEIFEDIYDEKEESSLVNGKEFNFLFGNMSNTSSMLDGNIDDLVSHGMDQEEEMQKDQNTYINYEEAKEESKEPALCDGQKIGIQVLFGNNQQNGEKVIWEPNNTDKLFHTNTGIIGTMGTGKTQFTQSIIAQFYQARENNIFSNDVGILIFDYKGDYNENKIDFVKFTDAKVYKPYHLPFNPFALHWSGTPKPLLPVHTANTFIDTLSKVYPNLGPKQKSVLLDCINAAYMNCGIHKANPATWVNEPPTFLSVYQRYKNDEEIKKGDVLESALNKISMFEIFEPVSSNTVGLFELLKGVVVIDLFGYDSDIQNLIVAMTLIYFIHRCRRQDIVRFKGVCARLVR
jgi:DNA phosphorothioation-dependent restriction protein DptH